jgi:hyaluronoglucosaminidase
MALRLGAALVFLAAGCAHAQTTAPAYTQQQVATAVAAGSSMYPFVWCATGPHAASVDFAGVPIRRDAVMFYEHQFGLYPRIWVPPNNPAVIYNDNGSIPQRTDWPAHLAKARQDIARMIPDPNWEGDAILDFEAWDPVWNLLNWRMKEESRRHVRARFPGLTMAQVEARAKQEFEAAAIDFMVRTIQFCKQERPRAKWGYFGYPYVHLDPYRATHHQRIFDECTAFYPDIYTTDYGGTDPSVRPETGRRLASVWEQGARTKLGIARQIAGTRPVYAVIWTRYHDMNRFYAGQFINDLDLRNAITVPRSAGADGSVFWDYIPEASGAQAYNQFFASRGAEAIRQFYLQIAPPPAPLLSVSAPKPFSNRVPTIQNGELSPRVLERTSTQTGNGATTPAPAPAPTQTAQAPGVAPLVKQKNGRVTTVTNAPIN